MGLRRLHCPPKSLSIQALSGPEALWGLPARIQGVSHDSYFYQAWTRKLHRRLARKEPYISEVDDLVGLHARPWSFHCQPLCLENAHGRSIVGLDMRGACSYAVAHVPIADPKHLVEVTEPKTLAQYWNDSSWQGYFQVHLRPRSSFLSPPLMGQWSSVLQGKTSLSMRQPDMPQLLFFQVSTTDELVQWIHTSEKDAWEHFFHVLPIQAYGAFAKEHPFASMAKSLWEQYQSESHAPTAHDTVTYKWLLSSLHTGCSSRKARHQLLSEQITSQTQACWSAQYMPLAWVRGQWLRQWARVVALFPSAVLCYANVDSMHISVTHADAQKIQDYFGFDAPWGQWRVQWVGSRGLWLGQGKYWIWKNDRPQVLEAWGHSGMPWASKISMRSINGTHELESHSHYRWHGLVGYNPLRYDKEVRANDPHSRWGRVYQDYPHYTSIRAVDDLGTWLHEVYAQSVLRDRPWKKKLWYEMRGMYEKTKNA